MNSLLRARQLDKAHIQQLLGRAQYFADHSSDLLRTYTLATLFFEPSTRTNLSFQMAATRLGIRVLPFSIEHSSLLKGESLQDTLQTLDALGVDAAVIRHSENWPESGVADQTEMALINAGSGVFEHPTQALLDALTIQQQFSTFSNLVITIVGDVLHSRVARSNIHILKVLGAKMQFAGPEEYMSSELEKLAPWVDFDQGIRESDVVMMLRIQHERHANPALICKEDYHRRYGMTAERMAAMQNHAVLLHPGPVNREVEVASEVLDHSRCLVRRQVANGVLVRMAVLEWCLQGGLT